MKKIFFPILLMILFMTGCGNDSTTNDKLVIGVDDEFAPMSFRDNQGKLVGFDIDLAEEAARRMGVEIEFKPIDWNKKETEITSGNVDMIWSGCDITDEYKAYMIFGKPYMDNRQVILIKKGSDINSLGDLAGKVVGTQSGSNSETYINSDAALKNTFAEFITYRSVTEGYEILSSGKCDALIIDEIAGRYEVIRQPDMFETVEVTVGPVTEFGVAFRKDNTALRNRVQKVFDEMIGDGTAREISERWFHADLIK